MSEDRAVVLARLEKARAARVGPGDAVEWACPRREEDTVLHGHITLYISASEVYCKCGRRMRKVVN